MKIHGLPSGGFSYNNLDIIPNIPTIKYNDVDLSVRLTPNINLNLPIISSPMDTVTDSKVAINMGRLGGIGILHNNYQSIQIQADEIAKVKKEKSLVGAAIPNVSSFHHAIPILVRAGVDMLALDSLHSDPHKELDTIKFIRNKFPHIEIMSGNIVHPKDVKKLAEIGVSCIRIGISAGSINQTRLLTGIGRSQGRSVFECAKEAKKYGLTIIADGGIKTTGDIVIALALGASAVMLGRMIATTEEAPGNVQINNDGKKIKWYRGMSTHEVISNQTQKGEYGQFEEGIKTSVEITTTVSKLFALIEQSMRIAFYRTNNKNTLSFQKNVELEYHP